MSYFNLITPSTNCSVKTIILQGKDCLRANTIREEIIKNGYQLLPESLYPNEIKIQYIVNNVNTNDNTNDINIISTSSHESSQSSLLWWKHLS